MKRKSPIEAVGSSELHTEFHNPKSQPMHEFIRLTAPRPWSRILDASWGSMTLIKDIGCGLRPVALIKNSDGFFVIKNNPNTDVDNATMKLQKSSSCSA